MKKRILNKKIAKYKLRTVLLSIGLLFCLAGCGKADEVIILSEGNREEENGEVIGQKISEETDEANGEANGKDSGGGATDGRNTTVCVYVCGAVKSPGVVEVTSDSRVEDALLAAGGFAEDACRDYVNLAARVTDGEMIYFPDVTECEVLEKKQLQEEAGMVDINLADVTQLCTLPGIGAAKAEAIVSYRDANGAFQSIEEIMNVPGIKTQAFEKIKNKITIN